MQDGWGGGEDMSLSASQWDQDEGDMWNSTASQESNSSCNSWGNPPKKGPPKVKELQQRNKETSFRHQSESADLFLFFYEGKSPKQTR